MISCRIILLFSLALYFIFFINDKSKELEAQRQRKEVIKQSYHKVIDAGFNTADHITKAKKMQAQQGGGTIISQTKKNIKPKKKINRNRKRSKRKRSKRKGSKRKRSKRKGSKRKGKKSKKKTSRRKTKRRSRKKK